MSDFAARLVQWQRQHGRHDLPWQNTRDPYRIWLSEVMLQQTQVVTVLEYYPRFLIRFPAVQDLAKAELDEVLSLWSGLGYYSRARNLHRCAVQVCTEWGGRFPNNARDLEKLSGIGPSTAAAIASFCFGECVSILDGNVKRVLARHAGVQEDIASRTGLVQLQQLAQERLPARSASMAAYTQGLMDLGATLCTPRKPRCEACPLRVDCVALAQDQVANLPVKTRQIKRQTQRLWLWWRWREDGSVWLVRRPDSGIWAGLYAPPIFESEEVLAQTAGAKPDVWQADPVVKHVLTHRDLYLHGIWQAEHQSASEPEASRGWFSPPAWSVLGLPAPVRRMLEQRFQDASSSR